MFADIHNHILPGVDDGARDVPEAVAMARLAVADGAGIMVATPHRRCYGRQDAPPDWVRDHVAALQAALDEHGVPLRILPGVEIPIRPELADELASGKLMTLGDTGRCLLVEPPFETLPDDTLENVRRIRDTGFGVVLAHPERNAVIQQDLSFAAACAEMGVVLQVTCGSILGRFGEQARMTAEAIVRRAPEWQIVLASDAHNLSDRAPGTMSAARDAAALLVGMEEAREMVEGRPKRVMGI